MPLKNFLGANYFRSTVVSVYRPYKKVQLFNVKQTVNQLAIRVNIPSAQVVYFTLEHTNPRMFRNCPVGKTQVNTFFYKGNRFPGMNKLLVPSGFMGNGFYHTTVGKPHMSFPAGSYTIMVANW